MFEVRAGARRAVIACGSASPYALNSAAAMSLARDKGFAALALTHAGVPTIPGELFFVHDRHAPFRSPGRERADALKAAAGFAYPVFCKPVSGSRGDFAEIVTGPEAFSAYLERAGSRNDAILVQPFLRGTEHRVIVLEGRALCAYEKAPPTVSGDGRATLAELVAAARAAGKPTTATLAAPEAALAAGEDGATYRAGDILPAGARVRLLGAQNRSAGGDARAVLAPAPAPLAQIGEAAAAALGLTFSGVDVFDLSPAGDLSDLMVIEANASPALMTLEAFGRMDLILEIWTANLKAALA